MIYNRWSTSHIEPKLRVDFWRDASEKVKTPITPHVLVPRDFEAKLTTRGLGNLALNHVQVLTPHDVQSTRSDLSRTEQPCLLVELYLQGSADVTQRNRSIRVVPGEPFVLDGRREYRLDHRHPVSMLALAVPFAALARHEGNVDKLIAQHHPNNPAVHLLAAQMKLLSTWPITPEAAEFHRLSDLLIGTVQAVLDGVTDDVSKGALKERSFLKRRLQQLIAQAYADPTLAPQVVSAKLGISVRTLHARLAGDGTSFGAELMAHRLDRSYQLLRTTRRNAVTIAEISHRCGFVSAAHFSRCFRARFGVAPSDVMRCG